MSNAAVFAYHSTNRYGEGRYLPEGTHWDVVARSMYIPQGWQVWLSDNDSGPLWLLITGEDDSANNLSRLAWGGMAAKCPRWRRMVVRRANHDRLSVATVSGPAVNPDASGYGETVHWSIVPGGNNADRGFCPHSVLTLHLKRFQTAVVRHGGGSVTLHGAGSFPLEQYGAGQPWCIDLSMDGIEAVGPLEIIEGTSKPQGPPFQSVAGTSTLSNRTQSEASLSKTVEGVVHESSHQDWGTGFSTQVTVGTGEASPLKFESVTGLEATFGGGNDSGSSATVSDTGEGTCQPGNRLRIELVATMEKKRAVCRQLFRNTITGSKFWETGQIDLSLCQKTGLVITELEGLD